MKNIKFLTYLLMNACLTCLYSEDVISAKNCTKEVLMTFFPQPLTKDILVRHGIAAETAEKISKELAEKDQDIVKLVDKKASAMNPNPFREQNQREEAIKIFKETLYEIFASVLKKHNITDETQIQSLLNELREAKGKLFIECMHQNTQKSND
jgi:hypothetical protein